MEQLTNQLESLIERNDGVPQQLKQRLIQESTNVKNPFHFIAVLINKGVLNDEPNQQDPNFGWTVGFIVQLLMTMAFSKGADAIISLMKALEESGNVEVVSALRTWVEDELAVEADGHLTSIRNLETSVAHTGTELIDNVMSHVKDELMGQLAFKACNIAHSTEMDSNLAHQDNVLDEPNLEHASESVDSPEVSPNLDQDEPNIEFTTGPSVRRRQQVQNSSNEFPSQTDSKFGELNGGGSVVETEKSEQLTTELLVHERKQIVKVNKAGYSKKAIVSLVLALILASFFMFQFAEISKRLENLPVKTKNSEQPQIHPQQLGKDDAIDVKILENKSRPTATGIFVATNEGLVALDLRTSKPTALTNTPTFAVAVNQKLKKVYWAEDGGWNSTIMRSNFNGSGKEVIVPPAGDNICMLGIDEQTGKVYYALFWSNKITVCNALGEECAVVISDSSLVNRPIRIVLDTKNGFMYWGHRPQSFIIFTRPHSLVRAKLDGSKATIIHTGFSNLAGITLDQPASNVLYWTDDEESTIGSINVNGGNKRTILRLEGEPKQGLTAIQVDAKEIYYMNWKSKNIKSVRKDSGEEMRTIFTSTSYVRDFELFSDLVKQS